MSPSTKSKVTTEHDGIRRWAEERGAKPAAVLRAESGDDSDIIRLDFPGRSGGGSMEISWDEWFKKFDERNLALLYQDQTAGGQRSNFNKIIGRDTAAEAEKAVGGKGRSASHKRGGSAQAVSLTGARGAARRSGSSEGRAETTKRATSARGHSSSNGRASTRSRTAEKRSSSSRNSSPRRQPAELAAHEPLVAERQAADHDEVT